MKKLIITLLIMFMLPMMSFAKTAQTINVAFTIDNNYPIYTMLAINSILLNNHSKSNFHFYIVEDNLTDKNKQKMTDILEKLMKDKTFKADMEFIKIDTSVADKGENLFAFLSHGVTPIAIARIFLPELLDVDRVIYLDGDILVTTDLLDLYNTNLGPYIVGMVPDITQKPYGTYYIYPKGYYNSGVILMDLNKCRKDKSTEKILNYLYNNFDKFLRENTKDEGPKFIYPDQDLINIVLEGKIKKLNPKWNNQTVHGVSQITPYIEGGTILHYIGFMKPWTFKAPNDLPIRLYMSNWKECPYLSQYRFYYASLKYINDYKNTIKLKIKRYIVLLKNFYIMSNGMQILNIYKIKE